MEDYDRVLFNVQFSQLKTLPQILRWSTGTMLSSSIHMFQILYTIGPKELH